MRWNCWQERNGLLFALRTPLQSHVREVPGVTETAWDVGFLALGVLLISTGWILTRSNQRRTPRM